MDLLIIAAGVLSFLICILFLALCYVVWKLFGRMPGEKQDRIITELYGLAGVVQYGIRDGSLSAEELRMIMASILSVIAALRGVEYEEIEKEFRDVVTEEDSDTYIMCLSGENIIPDYQQYSYDELTIPDEISLRAGKAYLYGIISAPQNARLTLLVRSSEQEAPEWNYIPTEQSSSDIVRIPFRIMYPEEGWKNGQYQAYVSLMDGNAEVVFDHVCVRFSIPL